VFRKELKEISIYDGFGSIKKQNPFREPGAGSRVPQAFIVDP